MHVDLRVDCLQVVSSYCYLQLCPRGSPAPGEPLAERLTASFGARGTAKRENWGRKKGNGGQGRRRGNSG